MNLNKYILGNWTLILSLLMSVAVISGCAQKGRLNLVENGVDAASSSMPSISSIIWLPIHDEEFDITFDVPFNYAWKQGQNQLEAADYLGEGRYAVGPLVGCEGGGECREVHIEISDRQAPSEQSTKKMVIQDEMYDLYTSVDLGFCEDIQYVLVGKDWSMELQACEGSLGERSMHDYFLRILNSIDIAG